MLGDVKLPYNNSKRNTTGMGHNCLRVCFFLLDLDSDSDLDLRSVDLDLDLDLPSLKRTWTRTWTCSLKVDLDLDLRIVDLDWTWTLLLLDLLQVCLNVLRSCLVPVSQRKQARGKAIWRKKRGLQVSHALGLIWRRCVIHLPWESFSHAVAPVTK